MADADVASLFKGFSKLNKSQRLNRLVEMGALTEADLHHLTEPHKMPTDLAEKFIIELTVNTLPTQYTYEFWVHDLAVDKRIYPQTTTPAHDQSKIDTQVIIPSNKIVYGILDKDTGDLFSPYDIEVLVWQ